jgi:nitroreductase
MTEGRAVAAAVAEALATRRSVRGFTAEKVPEATIREILALASRAPSMTNTQPWAVHVLTGAKLHEMCAEILDAYRQGDQPAPEYPYYPKEWRSPWIDRRRQIGWALYGLLGIAKGDRAATARQHARNFTFFGAPVGMIFTLDRDLGLGSWLDLGMFLQNVMTAARGAGLDTCPQAAFASYHGIIRRHLAIPTQEFVVCGMALGHADPEEPANRLQSPRVPVEGFTTFHGS